MRRIYRNVFIAFTNRGLANNKWDEPRGTGLRVRTWWYSIQPDEWQWCDGGSARPNKAFIYTYICGWGTRGLDSLKRFVSTQTVIIPRSTPPPNETRYSLCSCIEKEAKSSQYPFICAEVSGHIESLYVLGNGTSFNKDDVSVQWKVWVAFANCIAIYLFDIKWKVMREVNEIFAELKLNSKLLYDCIYSNAKDCIPRRRVKMIKQNIIGTHP